MSAGSSSFSLPTLDFLSPDSYNGVELIREKFVSLMPKRKKIIYLTGFMGSGKSTVGALLARELGWLFIDLDQTIEAGQGMTIRKIFETEGEPRFRWLEHAALRESVQNEPAVIALGGGTIVQRHNQALLREMGGTTIWLSCSPERLLARCAGMEDRPLFRGVEGFLQLLQERVPEYQKAEFRVTTDEVRPRQVVESILRLPIF
jgi:shikimate kinase